MPWDGSGAYTPSNGTHTGANIWGRLETAGADVEAAPFDAFTADLVTLFANTLTRDGQGAASADLPMGGNKHTNVGDATARTEYATFGQLSDRAITFVPAASVGGTGDAITLTPSPAITAHAINQSFRFVAKADNTGGVTAAVSGLAARTVGKIDSDGQVAALAAGEIQAGAVLDLWDNGAALVVVRGLTTQGFSGDYNDLTNKPDIPPNLGSDVTAIVVLTEAAYQALTPKVATTLYLRTA